MKLCSVDLRIRKDDGPEDGIPHFYADYELIKELFKEFGGSYESYLSQSETKLPLIVIILNNYDSFVENYSDLDDVLTHQLRDCAKYGIVFITTSVATNSMRASVQALYNTKMMMQVNDAFDYSYILDAQNHLTPAKYFGRGLIKLDNGTYEFQTAYIFEKDKINEVVKQTADKLIEIDMKKASKIPNIPKNVVYETMLKHIIELGYKAKVFQVDKYLCWGTPQDYENYENTLKYWFEFQHKDKLASELIK